MPASTADDTITLFTKTPCVQCGALKRAFTSNGIFERFNVTVRDLTNANDDELDRLRAMDLMQAPAVLGPTGSWAGYRPDMVEGLVKYADQHQLPANYSMADALAG